MLRDLFIVFNISIRKCDSCPRFKMIDGLPSCFTAIYSDGVSKEYTQLKKKKRFCFKKNVEIKNAIENKINFKELSE